MAKSRRLIWLLVILVILASFGAAAGFYLLYQEKAKTSAHASLEDAIGDTLVDASTPAHPAVAPIYLKLEPFTVNLADEDDIPRLLYAGMTLQLTDEQSLETLEQHRPQVRNKLLLLLSDREAESLVTASGKRALASDIVTTLKDVLGPDRARIGIDDVLFTEFIVQ
ncbi:MULTISPECIES: flagellar basal body-associated protein FliL [Halomonas]|uniref:flagellar basal body-associated protein FliL n=1 Tax=Halomonas TaxID=2745 RepID=UPI001C93BDF0|nr:MULTISPECIES: flagellar basal body-associated protein FliL [Halomonas]MBY6206148.1 flagellar basal body-associated protein FliL [Halomonas sp. DP3Y7-2]MBY6227961.1 flagellar basal body-associated protein FliL [Halomonas sp. DP3Y7-1]MCA0916028.1 flagellar basal body-associated protein FliL [Halomonas denitrificans]